MLKTIIIDDETECRATLQDLLNTYCPDVKILAQVDSVTSGLEVLKIHQPDCVFLDIMMQDGTGFDLLNKLQEITFEIIFTTAHDNFAIKAFKFSALDYLLKPVNHLELKHVVEKLEKKKNLRQPGPGLKNFMENQQAPAANLKKIALPTLEGLIFIELSTILYCEADEGYTWFFFEEGKKILVSKKIGEIESLLIDCNFYRIHKSHLINLDHLKKYIKGEGGSVILSNNVELDVARRKKDDFKLRIKKI